MPLDQAKLDRRIAASKSAELCVTLMLAEEATFKYADELESFWQTAAKLLKTKLQPAKPVAGAGVIPMSNADAREFSKSEIPFGKHAGYAVGDLLQEDPGYLRWCANQTFQEE